MTGLRNKDSDERRVMPCGLNTLDRRVSRGGRLWRTALKSSALVSALAIALLGNACGEGDEAGGVASPQAAAGAAVAKVGQAAASAAAPTDVQYTYSSVGKRDPFTSYLAQASKERPRDVERRKEATEEYELDQYRLTAIVTGTSQPRAMVEDPTGRGHVLHIGTRLGRNGGRVTRVTSIGITVVEETRDAAGKRLRVSKQINLPKAETDKIDLEGFQY